MDGTPGGVGFTHEQVRAVLTWFSHHAISYPWSITRDPYAVWISEVMLQQTVVGAVLGHYGRWMNRWPDVTSLAQASENEVMREWEGLGYYSRGKNLLRSAQKLANLGKVAIPCDGELLSSLPGWGDYTVAAVLSFAFGVPTLALDANLKRIFQRHGAINLWSKETEAEVKNQFHEDVLMHFESRKVNGALMQLGQQVCLPRTPRCGACPLVASCQAHAQGREGEIPEKKRKILTDLESRVGVYVRTATREVFLAHPEGGRFSHLWLFPVTKEEGVSLSSQVHHYTRYRHKLNPVLIFTQGPNLEPGWSGRWMTWSQADETGMPSVYRKIWNEVLEVLRVQSL